MGPEATAVVVSVLVTSIVAMLGAWLLQVVSRGRPARGAFGAPVVVVASLGAGVAAASRSMLIAEDDRTLVFVLLAGAPIAVVIGVLLARRVAAMEREAAHERAERDRAVALEADRRETVRWLSHDVRTPLAGIRLLAESVVEGGAQPATSARRIIVEADRIDAMVDDIAELSRLHGMPSSTRERVWLADLVSDAVETVQAEAVARGVVLIDGGSAAVVLTADARSLVRAVTNLVRNAVQHTPAGGAVRVSVRRAPATASIEVEDGCGGIAPESLARVFDAGWRGDESRTTGPGATSGMGLGLAIVREAARLHGGDVHASNLPDGSGCRFVLALPVEDLSEF